MKKTLDFLPKIVYNNSKGRMATHLILGNIPYWVPFT